MGPLVSQLQEMMSPVVEALGYELWGIEYFPQGANSLLRIYIDGEHGITLEDCETVSQQVSVLLDVADPISSHYRLEVSSPGLDRLLFNEAQYRRYVGCTVKVSLKTSVDGRKRLTGVLKAVKDDGEMCICENAQDFLVSLANLDKVRLLPEVKVN